MVGVTLAFVTHGQSTGVQPPLTSRADFDAAYATKCGGSLSNSTACLQFVADETRAHFRFTDYLSKEDVAVGDVLEAAEQDWQFAVDEFNRLEPLVQAFTGRNGTTMQTLVDNLTAEIDTFVSKVNPVLAWSHKNLTGLLDADLADATQFTNETDAAAKRMLDAAMKAGQVYPHQVNMYAKNASDVADKFFNAEFFRVKNGLDSKFAAVKSRQFALATKLKDSAEDIAVRTNLANVTAGQLDAMLTNVLAPRIAASRANLRTVFEDRVNAKLRGADFSRALADTRQALLNASSASLRPLAAEFDAAVNSMGDAVEAKLNRTIRAALETVKTSLAKYSTSDSSAEDTWTELARLLEAMTQATQGTDSAAVEAYIFSDDDLAEDSIANFTRVSNEIKTLIADSGTREASQISVAKAQVRDFAAAALGRLEAKFTQILTMSDLKNTGVNAAYANWTDFAKTFYATGLKDLYTHFRAGIKTLSDQVYRRVTLLSLAAGDVVSNGSPLADLLSADYSLLTSEETNEIESKTSAERQRVVDLVTYKLSNLTAAMDETGKANAIETLTSAGKAAGDRIAASVDSALRTSRESLDQLTAGVKLHQIEEPGNAGLAKVAVHQRTAGDLNNVLLAAQKKIAQLKTDYSALGSDMATKFGSIDTSLSGRERWLQLSFDQVEAEMAGALAAFQSEFVNAMPAATGFPETARQREDTTVALERWIGERKIIVQQRIAARFAVVDEYVSKLTKAGGVIDAASNIMRETNGMVLPDLAKLGAVKSLADRLDQSGEEAKLDYAIGNERNRILAEFKDKDLSVTNAINEQKRFSSDRVNEQATGESQLSAKSSSWAYIGGSVKDRVQAAVGRLTTTLDGYGSQLSVVKTSSEGQMRLIEELFANELVDLLHQVKEAAPEFLKQYESDKVTFLIERLRSINSTISAINAEAIAQFETPPGAFIHLPEIQASTAVKDIVKIVSNKSDVADVTREISKAVKRIESKIHRHVPLVASIPESPDILVNAFVNATEEVCSRLARVVPTLLARITKAAAERNGRLDNATNAKSTEWIAFLRVVEDEVKNATRLETDIGKSIPALERRSGQLRESVNELKALQDAVLPVTRDADITLETRVDESPVGESAKLRDLRTWFDELVASSQQSLNDRLASESAKVNATVVSIESVKQQLEEMTKSEAKMENDFETKILPRLRDRNARIASETDQALTALDESMTSPSTGDEQAMEEIHNSLRRSS